MEREELKVIQSKLKLDTKGKNRIAEYPWKGDPNLLENNYNQVYKMLVNAEKRLTRSKATMELFNEQINDFISRGDLKLFSKSELRKCNGPIHYLSTHEIYKEDVNATTPVRLVVNSALQHNGSSLNSMLMKGPASLNDLFNVMHSSRAVTQKM